MELSTNLGQNNTAETVSPEEILKHVQTRLQDPANGVRLAAAKGLTSLLSQLDKGLFEDIIIENIIAAARSDNGAQAREMGRVLRKINIETSTNSLLEQLDTLQSSSERRFVIELLEEILVPEQSNSHSV